MAGGVRACVCDLPRRQARIARAGPRGAADPDAAGGDDRAADRRDADAGRPADRRGAPRGRRIRDRKIARRCRRAIRTPASATATAPLPNPASMPQWNGWGPTITNTHFQPAAQAGLTADAGPASAA